MDNNNLTEKEVQALLEVYGIDKQVEALPEAQKQTLMNKLTNPYSDSRSAEYRKNHKAFLNIVEALMEMRKQKSYGDTAKVEVSIQSKSTHKGGRRKKFMANSVLVEWLCSPINYYINVLCHETPTLDVRLSEAYRIAREKGLITEERGYDLCKDIPTPVLEIFILLTKAEPAFVNKSSKGDTEWLGYHANVILTLLTKYKIQFETKTARYSFVYDILHDWITQLNGEAEQVAKSADETKGCMAEAKFQFLRKRMLAYDKFVERFLKENAKIRYIRAHK
jgi:hypothetical protein